MDSKTTGYQYYPALSNLISIDDLPEILSFLQNGLQKKWRLPVLHCPIRS
jgi:hypothetical protein